MSEERLVALVPGCWWAVKLTMAAALLFGAFSAAAPRRSIALYQRLMAWFNWRVSPIDERRELRTTVGLGVLIAVLSLIGLWLACSQQPV